MGISPEPREEFTHINVRSNGQWYNDDKLIINENVLTYFKSNLKRDDKGIYVHNTFGEFSEKGYIQVKGPIVNVIEITNQSFILENGQALSRKEVILVLDNRSVPFIYLVDFKAWAGFTKSAMVAFSEDIEERNGELFLQDKVIKQIADIDWQGELEQ